MNRTMVVAGLVCVAFLACGDKQDPNSSSKVQPEGGVNYTNDVKTILDQYCIRCHSSDLSGTDRNGAPASINLNTYKAASEEGKEANKEIQSGGMPPNGDKPSGTEKATFQAWVDEGFSE